MSIGAGQQYWDEQARTDPMWAILVDPQKTGRRWDPEEFFSTGVYEIASVMERLGQWGLPVSRKRALDFGCGVGRLTQPLADYFEEVRGVDVSPVMLEQARQFNRQGDRCQFIWNGESDLRMFADRSIDFIYSKITLQHIRPRRVRSYLREFMRLLAPEGLLLFQLPSRAVCPYPGIFGRIRFRVARIRSLMRVPPAMYMNGIGRDRVIALLKRHGGRVVEIEPNTDAGPEYESFLYAVTLAK
jgi:SAM-dependent methyltransferase